jgi:hypothetical protein
LLVSRGSSRLAAGFAVGAALDAVMLWAAGVALLRDPGIGPVLGAVLAGTWLFSAVAGARSTACALDSAPGYVRTHGWAGLGLAVLWAMDPAAVDVGLAAMGTTVAAWAVIVGRRAVSASRVGIGWTWETLRLASGSELTALLRAGRGPEPEALVGRRYRALSLGPLSGRGGRRKAFRAFFHAPRGPAVEGCERAALPGPVESPWAMVVDPGDGLAPGWFVVERDGGPTRLDWTRSRRNPTSDPRRGLTELLVEARPGDPTLLLGRRFQRVAGLLVPLGWFLLADAGAHGADGSRPRDGAW